MIISFISVLSEKESSLLERIFQEKHKLFCYTARKIVGSSADPEDIVSASYIKLMEKIDRYSHLTYEEMIALCVTIIKRKSYNAVRRTSLFEVLDGMEDAPDLNTCSPEDKIIHDEEVKHLTKVIEALPQDDRHMLQMRFQLKMKYKDIGAMLGISEEAAKKRCQRVVQKVSTAFCEN